MSQNENNLGVFLQSKRFEMNMSLRDFAVVLDISHSYLRILEKGVTSRKKPVSPTIDLLLQIADSLHMSRVDFFRACKYI